MTTSALLRILMDNPPKLIANGLREPEVMGKVIDFQRGFTTRDDMILMLMKLPEGFILASGRPICLRELKQMNLT